jgi:thiamine biosynthesis lipoprotein
MRRRRFLAVLAGAAAFPALAATPLRWSGVALGAEAAIALAAPEEVARPALAEALAAVEEVEATFSLYRPDSLLARLNRDGRAEATPLWHRLHDAVDALHEATGGLFDPSVQPAWAALARGAAPVAGPGWGAVRRDGDALRLARGQRLTFNGIAQGFATDLVVEALARHGLADAQVDIGEQAAIGPPRRLGLVGALTLRDGALATSSALATPLGATGHVLRPDAPWAMPLRATVSVEAARATEADALSTAGLHADDARLAALRARAGVRRIVTVDRDGDVRTL